MDTDTIPAVYTQTFSVEWDNTAATGRLSLPGLLNFIQLTAGDHANVCRFGYYEMTKAHQAWVLTRLKVQFSDLPKWTEKVEVSTWIETFNGTISVRNMLITHQGNVIAKVSTVWVCINYQKRAPECIAIPYPKDIILPDRKLDITTASRIKIPSELSTLREYHVSYSDIDAMGHVNNIKYTQWILDSLPYEKALSIKQGTIEVNFLSELHIGDTVLIEYSPDNSQDTSGTFVIRRKGDEKPAFLSHFTAE
ncbi:MAG: thioesterase [Flavobacteriales bacterium]|nr:thioesterase [Flavobacteriales bacterium]